MFLLWYWTDDTEVILLSKTYNFIPDCVSFELLKKDALQ